MKSDKKQGFFLGVVVIVLFFISAGLPYGSVMFVHGATTPKIISFSASQTQIPYPGAVTLTWLTADATSCLSSFWGSTSMPLPGGSVSVPVVALGGTTFTMTCTDASGASVTSDPVTVTIVGGAGVTPEVSLVVSDGSIGAIPASSLTLPAGGGDIVLQYRVKNADGCRTTNTGTSLPNWADSFVPLSGSQNKNVPLTIATTTTFTIMCATATDSTTKSVAVSVNGAGGGGPCVPNGACTAANTCNTTTCTTNCGVVIPGTKVCGGGGGGGNGGGVATGGLIPCGKSFGSAAEQAPCTVCHIIVGGNNLIKWGLGIMSVIAITVMFAMAVLYVVSAGNPGMMQTAKGGIFAVLIGFGVMLSAWLIVNTVLTILVNNADNTKPLGGLVQQGVFKFSCDTSSNVNR